MNNRSCMQHVRYAAQCVEYHSHMWLLAAETADEERHRRSIISWNQAIEAALQNRYLIPSEPWLSTRQVELRAQYCKALTAIKTSVKIDG
jgi:hypothetical protein